ncbi:MAG: nicotinate phosphoribosyltransferase [Clostridiales bacterium]|nr:nicotinate phosphoribosyltransferase [Clostridiales bacterium]
MLTDLYQLTMMNGYFAQDMRDNEAVFDMFFRQMPENRAYAVFAGLESVVRYIGALHFADEDIAYLRGLGIFGEAFLKYLRDLRFTGDIYAVPEGTVVFPGEPILRVKAPIMEAQLLETAILNLINHQTLIATKASRVVYAANGQSVTEFGLRRAQGPDAGVYGARAAVIGGCDGTSNVMAGRIYGIPVKGTHAHSWVMSFPDEISAFRAYAKTYPGSCLLLVDTFDTLRSGVPNAITVFNELRAAGHEPIGIRLDSGDLAYLSKKAREMLDNAGFESTIIFASSDLDETVIRDLKLQGACIDAWGVGTRLITSSDCPALGGVYKLCAEVINGVIVPKLKRSDNPIKITDPGYKKVYRLYKKKNGKAIADLITLEDESIDTTKPLRIFDPVQTWKSMVVTDFTARALLQPIFIGGRQQYALPRIAKIQAYAKAELATIWDEYKRLLNPHTYKVDLSDKLYDLKQKLLRDHQGEQNG